MWARQALGYSKGRIAPPTLLRNSPRYSSSAAVLSSSSTVADARAVTQANRVSSSLKRFWKAVDVVPPSQSDSAGQWLVHLDKAPLKTPGGQVLALPSTKRMAATLVAVEWDVQDKLIKPHALPMTSLVSRAIDGLQDPSSRSEVRSLLIKYLDTDTICYHETQPPALVKLQEEQWAPFLERIRTIYGVQINVIDSLFGKGQPAATRRIFEAVIEDFDQWELAALERSVYSTKSFLIALAFVQGQLSVEQAATIAQVEVSSQIKTWGEVEDSHDVDYRDIRRQLGSVASLLVDT